VIKTADGRVDMGPEGGDGGGEVVAVGTPEEVAACERSHTGKFLREGMGLEAAYPHEKVQPLREAAA
jgi:excinuclease ABC subunit A